MQAISCAWLHCECSDPLTVETTPSVRIQLPENGTFAAQLAPVLSYSLTTRATSLVWPLSQIHLDCYQLEVDLLI